MGRPWSVGSALAALVLAAAPAQSQTGAAADSPDFAQHKAAALRLAGARYAAAAEHQCQGRPGIPPENRLVQIAPARVMDNLYYVGLGWVGAWAITTSDGIVLIDTLDSEKNADEVIVGGLTQLGLDPNRLKVIILTHNHADHTSGAPLLVRRYHPRVYASAPEWEIMEGKRPAAGNRPTNPPARDLTLQDGQTIQVGDTPFTFILTPGHTPGSTSIVFPSSDAGRKHVVALVGGVTAQPNLDSQMQALEGLQRLSAYARQAKVDVEIVDHVHVDDSMARTRAAATRAPGDPNAFVIGQQGFQDFLGMLMECYQANMARLRAQTALSAK
jgi:metallo-beta-lactamase class B